MQQEQRETAFTSNMSDKMNTTKMPTKIWTSVIRTSQYFRQTLWLYQKSHGTNAFRLPTFQTTFWCKCTIFHTNFSPSSLLSCNFLPPDTKSSQTQRVDRAKDKESRIHVHSGSFLEAVAWGIPYVTGTSAQRMTGSPSHMVPPSPDCLRKSLGCMLRSHDTERAIVPRAFPPSQFVFSELSFLHNTSKAHFTYCSTECDLEIKEGRG